MFHCIDWVGLRLACGEDGPGWLIEYFMRNTDFFLPFLYNGCLKDNSNMKDSPRNK